MSVNSLRKIGPNGELPAQDEAFWHAFATESRAIEDQFHSDSERARVAWHQRVDHAIKARDMEREAKAKVMTILVLANVWFSTRNDAVLRGATRGEIRAVEANGAAGNLISGMEWDRAQCALKIDWILPAEIAQVVQEIKVEAQFVNSDSGIVQALDAKFSERDGQPDLYLVLFNPAQIDTNISTNGMEVVVSRIEPEISNVMNIRIEFRSPKDNTQ